MPSYVLDTVQCTKDSVTALKEIILSETRKALFILYSILSIQVSMTKEGIHGCKGCKTNSAGWSKMWINSIGPQKWKV